jgi:hypothetical protein
MINQLPELEEEDKRYNLHVGAEKPDTYNLTLLFPDNSYALNPLYNKFEVKNALQKLGILLK